MIPHSDGMEQGNRLHSDGTEQGHWLHSDGKEQSYVPINDMPYLQHLGLDGGQEGN